jgi:hypothetical protein
VTPTDVDLRPYGWRPGNVRGRYCEFGNHKFTGDGKAFKCRACAESQWREVEDILDSTSED